MGALQSISRLWRGPPAHVAATGWSAAGALIAAGLILLVSDAVAALLFGSDLLGLRPRQPGLLRLEGQTAVQMASLTSQALTVALTLAASARLGSSVRDTLALGPPAGGCLAHVTGVLLCLLLTENAHVLLAQVLPADISAVRHTGRMDWLLDGLASIVGAPVAEELLFRGFLTGALARSALGYGRAAVVTSALWAVLHYRYPVAWMLLLFAVGLLLSWLLWRTGSVRVPILCHAIVGAFAFLTGSSVGPRA